MFYFNFYIVYFLFIFFISTLLKYISRKIYYYITKKVNKYIYLYFLKIKNLYGWMNLIINF